MTERNEIAAKFIADFEQRIVELEELRTSSDHWVLWLNGMGLTFKVASDGRCYDPRPCRIEDAYHLKKSEAVRLAPETWDGNGDKAIAMTFANAVDLTIAETKTALETIDRLMAGG